MTSTYPTQAELVSRLRASSASPIRRMIAQAMPVEPVRPTRKRKAATVPDNVDPNHPIMLEAAARLAFPDGSMTVSGLRNEIRKGNLRASKLAGRMYVTLNDIQQMRERCKVGAGNEARERISTSARQSGPVASGGGSSSTPHQPASALSEAQAHLQVIARRLKEPLESISPESTSQVSAVVIPLKS